MENLSSRSCVSLFHIFFFGTLLHLLLEAVQPTAVAARSQTLVPPLSVSVTPFETSNHQRRRLDPPDAHKSHRGDLLQLTLNF